MLLPEEEARQVTKEITSAILNGEDGQIGARFDPEERVGFTSRKQYQLFELLHILRRLDPTLADSLMKHNSEFAAAAAVFPFGMDSVREAWESRSGGRHGERTGGGFVLGGSDQDIAFGRALLKSRQSRRFEAPFRQAMDSLEEDLKSNGAIRECWPSTQCFRQLFYEIGRSLGEDGSGYLERIPDPDIRLFAQIEFAGALAGLPVYSGMRMTSPSHRSR